MNTPLGAVPFATMDGLETIDDIPQWSGIPVPVTSDLIIVPMHVTDHRFVTAVGWTHVDMYESIGGDIEYHVYRRD